jgi:hypothetical protein
MAGTDMLQVMRRALERWSPHMEKMTHSMLEFASAGDGFTVTARWDASRAGPAGAHVITFTRARVLGPTTHEPPLRQRPVKKTCHFRDDIIREVLGARSA